MKHSAAEVLIFMDQLNWVTSELDEDDVMYQEL